MSRPVRTESGWPGDAGIPSVSWSVTGRQPSTHWTAGSGCCSCCCCCCCVCSSSASWRTWRWWVHRSRLEWDRWVAWSTAQPRDAGRTSRTRRPSTDLYNETAPTWRRRSNLDGTSQAHQTTDFNRPIGPLSMQLASTVFVHRPL